MSLTTSAGNTALVVDVLDVLVDVLSNVQHVRADELKHVAEEGKESEELLPGWGGERSPHGLIPLHDRCTKFSPASPRPSASQSSATSTKFTGNDATTLVVPE